MSQLKKIAILALGAVILAKLSYAGISNIADTAFSDSQNATRSSTLGSSSDTGHTSTTTGVICGAITSSTEEGCNAALGISSGAIATPCDGGKYTCTLPVATRAENPACDSGAKSTAAECTAQGATAEACGTEGKYNCVCASNYTQTCNSAENKFPDPSEMCTNSKGETYIPNTSTCLLACRAEGNGFSLYDSQSAAQGSGCQGEITKCFSNASATFRWQCDQSCSTMNKLYPQYQQSSGDCSEYNGEPSAYTCGEGTKLCQCNTSRYMSNFDALMSCVSPQRPLTDDACVAENPLNPDKSCKSDANGDGVCDAGKKYQQACGYPYCTNTDMTMMNLVYCDGSGWHKTIGNFNISATNLSGNYYSLDSECSENTSASGIYAGGTKEKYSCTIQHNSVCDASGNLILQRVKVCSCADNYKYVPADTTFSATEVSELGLTQCAEGEVPLGLASKDDTEKSICIWNAQTSIVSNASSNNGTNGKQGGVDATRFRYGNKCLRKCEAWEEGIPEMTGDSCGEGLTMGVCAANKGDDSSLGATIPVYYEHKYCSCPRDPETGANLYKDSCPSGMYLGGKTCQNEGSLLYQYCLKPCVSADGATYSAWDDADDTCGFPQNMGGTYAEYEQGEDANAEDVFNACFASDKASEVSVQCHCPEDYSTSEVCAADGGKIGTGKTCDLDRYLAPETKYEQCSPKCPANTEATIANTEGNCNFVDQKFNTNTTNAIACYTQDDIETPKYQCLCPSNYQSKVEHCGGSYTTTGVSCDSTCRDCMNKTIGVGTPCSFESKVNGVLDEQTYKYHNSLGWGESCSYLQEQADNNLMIDDVCPYATNNICYNDSGVQKKVCRCPDDYQTLEEFCTGKEGDCLSSYVGIGVACELDVVNKNKLKKYASFGKKCPAISERPIFDSADSCAIGEVQGQAEPCYEENNGGTLKYICTCPESFSRSCDDPTQIRGGAVCSLETSDPNAYKYEKCLPQCQNTTTTPVVANPESCPLVDGFQSNTEEQCFNKLGDAAANYACRCPKGQNYQTLAEYCQNGVSVGGRDYTREECLTLFTGVGTPCTYDGVGVNKYRSFSIICPTDRPVLNSASDCSTASIPGSVDYYCYERDNTTQQRVVCKCPESWVDIQGNSGGAAKCDATEEPSGQTCSFDGPKSIKYEACYTRCDKLSSNGKGVTYLEEEDNSKVACTNLLGDGATLGVDGDGGACSRNNTLMYPCYCGSSYTERCLNSENEIPAPDSLACTINGTTYYESCANNDCSEESSTIAIIDDTDVSVSADVLCQAKYGTGATGKRCGEKKVECSCNAREYTETCEYPYKTPDKSKVKWCKYSTSGGLMSNGKDHFPLGACMVEPELAKCGKYILNADGTQNTSYAIKTATTEAACRTQYGSGVSAQLCEYDDNPNKRAYNCYYKASDYPWTEDNCPIRHVLSSDYIIINGVRHYSSCDCHSAYKYHKYNCAGMLSGSACEQKVDNKKASDETLKDIADGTTLAFYPYCQCTADYNQVCDGERYVGVGEPCNGKYRACECKPDPLPENWADNYYGCPGGKKPTGVTKPNGCGGKYYQCSVTECTWQHTETCPAPLIGVDPCQDNEGNIGGYKSCKCPDGYVICPTGTVGEGEPCLLKGKYYYQESNCVEEGKCAHGESQTCSGPLQIGVNPCKRNGITYFEYCVCASGYNKKCNGDNEVGVGDYCLLDETKFYSACANPSMTCTSEHKLSCDSNQTSYDPCVNSDNQVLYKCKCPTNYLKCEETGKAEGADSCTDANGTVYSACAVSNGCTEFQLNSYKVCSEFQIGSGGSCVDTEGVTRYAKCSETSECRANGYQYTCQGYDETIQGEACVDENGNKLYKQCKCPTSYVECTGKNNTKGTSCVPLNANGTVGSTVYSSCTCDASIYKYTCETDPDAGNIGIVKGAGKECTYTDAEGNSITKYEVCSCNSAYKYSCTGNGQEGDETDFCQTPGATPLYKQCTCKAEFNQSCVDASNPGMTIPRDANKACTPQNTGDDVTRYSSCECGAQYTLSCDSQGQIKSETNFCRPDATNPSRLLYNSCDCDALYQYNCKPSGANQGIKIPSGTSEVCVKQSYQNDILQGVEYYRTCECKPEYNKTCTGVLNGKNLTPDLYVGLSSDYCEITTSSTEGEVTTAKTYKKCSCPDNFVTCPSGTIAPDSPNEGEYCVEVASNGTITEKYKDGTCLCVPLNPGDGYIAANLQDPAGQNRDGATISASSLSASNQAALKQIFLQNCKHEKNGTVKGDGCGNLYYKCLLDPNSYPYNSDNCLAPKTLQGSKVSGNGWNGFVEMREKCDCPSEWYSQERCTALSKQNTGKCIVSGQSFQSGGTIACDDVHNGYESGYGKPDPSIPALKIYGDSCTKDDGTVVKKYCECNMDIFDYYYTGVSPNCLCIDPRPDGQSCQTDKINAHVYVCYFGNVTAKNVVCPNCKACGYANVSSWRYQVSKSYSH